MRYADKFDTAAVLETMPVTTDGERALKDLARILLRERNEARVDLDTLHAQLDEHSREWVPSCERLAADPHNAKLLADRVNELLRERDELLAKGTVIRLITERDKALDELDEVRGELDAVNNQLLYTAKCLTEADAQLDVARRALEDAGNLMDRVSTFASVGMYAHATLRAGMKSVRAALAQMGGGK